MRTSPQKGLSPFLLRQMNRPAAVAALAFAAGIAVSGFCRHYSFGLLAAAAALLLWAAALALRSGRAGCALAAALGAVFLTGGLMALAHRDGIPDTDVRRRVERREFPLGEPVPFDGCVVDEGIRRGDEISATVAFLSFRRGERRLECRGGGTLRIATPARATAAGVPGLLGRGDRIRAWAVWQKPRNYENPGSADRAGALARRGIAVTGKVKSVRLLERIPGGCADPWTRMAGTAGAHVRRSFERLRAQGKDQQSAILASLVVGDYSGLGNATREVFQNTGTYHVLVVSGLHVAWLAAVLLQLCRFVRIPERVRYPLAAVLILFYTCVVGFQASITRCLWMFLLYLAGRSLFRRADPVNILLAAALLLLAARPVWLMDTGFQLSFLAVMAIALTALPAVRRYLNPVWDPLAHAGRERLFLRPGRWHRLGRRLRTECEMLVEAIAERRPPRLARLLLWGCRGTGRAGFAVTAMILTTLSVQLWMEPLLAMNFNRIGWIAPLANLVIVPLSSAVLAAGIAAALAAHVPVAAGALLALAGQGASLLLACAAWFASFGAGWQRCPTPGAGWVLAGILLLCLWGLCGWRRSWIPCAYVAALLACLSCNARSPAERLFQECREAFGGGEEGVWTRGAPPLRLTFLDVGEGDAVVIAFPDRRVWLLDAGGLALNPSREEDAYAFDIGEAVVSRYLWHEWTPRLDRVILSHADQDHAGGLRAVLRNFPVSEFRHAQHDPDAALRRILRIAGDRKVPEGLLFAGMEDSVGPVSVRVLHPPADAVFRSSNETSVVLRLACGRFAALLTGDLEKAGEAALLARTEEMSGPLLKVAHHGSRFATSEALLGRVRPRWAVVSVGRNNPFRHPAREVMDRLRRHGVRPLLTMDEGAITFETDGRRYRIRSHVRGILETGMLPTR